MDKIYDVIILGAGPGGLAAGIYAGRARLDTLLIEKGKDGGQIAITDEIENYPGQMVDGESGPSLIERMTKQVEKFGAERVSDTIVSVDIEGPVKTLVGSNGTYKARTLIIATGAFPRPIGCKGEGEFMGKGVSYCATCDGNFFAGKEVVVVGRSNIVGKPVALLCLQKNATVTIAHSKTKNLKEVSDSSENTISVEENKSEEKAKENSEEKTKENSEESEVIPPAEEPQKEDSSNEMTYTMDENDTLSNIALALFEDQTLADKAVNKIIKNNKEAIDKRLAEKNITDDKNIATEKGILTGITLNLSKVFEEVVKNNN